MSHLHLRTPDGGEANGLQVPVKSLSDQHQDLDWPHCSRLSPHQKPIVCKSDKVEHFFLNLMKNLEACWGIPLFNLSCAHEAGLGTWASVQLDHGSAHETKVHVPSVLEIFLSGLDHMLQKY